MEINLNTSVQATDILELTPGDVAVLCDERFIGDKLDNCNIKELYGIVGTKMVNTVEFTYLHNGRQVQTLNSTKVIPVPDASVTIEWAFN